MHEDKTGMLHGFTDERLANPGGSPHEDCHIWHPCPVILITYHEFPSYTEAIRCYAVMRVQYKHFIDGHLTKNTTRVSSHIDVRERP